MYVIISLYTYNEPRRLLDYCLMKTANYDVENDNYIIFKRKVPYEFIFNDYKTKKVYDTQIVKINPELSKILKNWIRLTISKTDNLLFDTKFEIQREHKSGFDVLSQSQLNIRLNKIFDGKKISVNMLRHSYLTHKYGDINIKTINETAHNMGNSAIQNIEYAKSE